MLCAVVAVGFAAASPPGDVGNNSDAVDRGPGHAGEAPPADNASVNNATAPGPNDGLPAHVPDHVTQIHHTISSFLNGSIDNLGEAIQSITSEEGNESPTTDPST